MKIAKSFLAGLFFVGTLAAVNTGMAEGVIVEKHELAPGNYCHQVFPALRAPTFGMHDPILQSPGTGDVIDFYGSCSESPTGDDQMWQQRLDREHQLDRGYSD